MLWGAAKKQEVIYIHKGMLEIMINVNGIQIIGLESIYIIRLYLEVSSEIKTAFYQG